MTNPWEYQCQAYLLKWEPFPKPLSLKNPLTINNIGLLIALIEKLIIVIPLLIGYKYERKRRREGDWKKARKREREKSDLNEFLPRTTQSRKLKPTIQVSYEPKLDLAQGFYLGDAQLAPSMEISYKTVVQQGLTYKRNV